jgi:hypothetical protein
MRDEMREMNRTKKDANLCLFPSYAYGGKIIN